MEIENKERNALAELSEQLQNYHSQSPIIYKAQRIVEELAKVESLYEKMNAKARNGHIVEAEELAHELHLAKESMFAHCREIAEKGEK